MASVDMLTKKRFIHGLKTPTGDVEHMPILPEDLGAIVGHLAGRLPVPRVTVYSASEDNVLKEPYTLQVCLPGTRLDAFWEDLDQKGKLSIIDQYVELIAKLEAITFDTAGTFEASSMEPASTGSYSPLGAAEIAFLGKGEKDFVKDSSTKTNRAGSDIKALLLSHLEGWCEQERKDSEEIREESLRMPYYIRMKKISKFWIPRAASISFNPSSSTTGILSLVTSWSHLPLPATILKAS
ncbi:MAG: hypothetical protein Q9174_004653 [Haloplaca sp. 1 TL-2023]